VAELLRVAPRWAVELRRLESRELRDKTGEQLVASRAIAAGYLSMRAAHLRETGRRADDHPHYELMLFRLAMNRWAARARADADSGPDGKE
jgi:hypothetical protein